MHIAVAKLVSASPYSQSRYHGTPELEKESKAAYEERTWRERMHANEAGFIIIPPMSFKNCLSDAAKYLSVQIPGKGKSTYTKHFEAGVLVTEPMELTIRRDEVPGERLFVPSDGKRGASGGQQKRVERIFGRINQWSGEVTFHVLDDTITEDVFRYHLEQAGRFIGIGRFRPRNNGYYGRFNVESLTWNRL